MSKTDVRINCLALRVFKPGHQIGVFVAHLFWPELLLKFQAAINMAKAVGLYPLQYLSSPYVLEVRSDRRDLTGSTCIRSGSE